MFSWNHSDFHFKSSLFFLTTTGFGFLVNTLIHILNFDRVLAMHSFPLNHSLYVCLCKSVSISPLGILTYSVHDYYTQPYCTNMFLNHNGCLAFWQNEQPPESLWETKSLSPQCCILLMVSSETTKFGEVQNLQTQSLPPNYRSCTPNLV